MSDAPSAREIIRASTDLFNYISEGNQSIASDEIEIPVKRDEIDQNMNNSVWPSIEDFRLLYLTKKFVSRGGVLMLTIESHLALFCVLQLRSECGLRGIRPSKLFGNEIINCLCRVGVLSNVEIEIDMNRSFENNSAEPTDSSSIIAVRTEFIMQCFRQLGANRSSTIYRLAALWRYSLHDVRIMHINALLDLYLDDLVDEMIPQVCW